MRNRFDGMFSGLVDLVDGLRTLSLQQSAKVIERNLSRLLKSVYGPGGDSWCRIDGDKILIAECLCLRHAGQTARRGMMFSVCLSASSFVRPSIRPFI